MKFALLTIATVLAVGSLSACTYADTTMTAATTATSDASDTFVSPYLTVAVQGSGPDTLLIPGLASSVSVWDTTVPALKARTHVAQNVAIYSKTPDALARIREDAASSDRDTVTRGMSALLTTDLRPALEDIAQPVTVVHATDPAMGLPDGAMRALYEREYAGLTDVDIVTISDSYHFIMDDQPQAFQAALSTALEASR